MKGKNFIYLSALLLVSVLVAAVPDTLNIDLQASNASGVARNTTYSGPVRIYQHGSGSPSFLQVHTVTSNNQGVLNIYLYNLVNLTDDVQYDMTFQPGGQTESTHINISGNLYSTFSKNATFADNTSFANAANYNDLSNKPTINGSSTTDELQNLYDTITTDSGSVTANSNTDTLSILCSGNCSTSAGSDTVTLNIHPANITFDRIIGLNGSSDTDELYVDIGLTANDTYFFVQWDNRTEQLAALNASLATVGGENATNASNASFTSSANYNDLTNTPTINGSSTTDELYDDGPISVALTGNDTYFFTQWDNRTEQLAALNASLATAGGENATNASLSNNATYTSGGNYNDLSNTPIINGSSTTDELYDDSGLQENITAHNATFEALVGFGCGAGDFVNAIGAGGLPACGTPAGGGGAGDKWITNSTLNAIEPNSTFSVNVYIKGFLNISGSLYSNDWTNVTITEGQITDLSHYVDVALTANDTYFFVQWDNRTEQLAALNASLATVGGENATNASNASFTSSANYNDLTNTPTINGSSTTDELYDDGPISVALTGNDTYFFTQWDNRTEQLAALNDSFMPFDNDGNSANFSNLYDIAAQNDTRITNLNTTQAITFLGFVTGAHYTDTGLVVNWTNYFSVGNLTGKSAGGDLNGNYPSPTIASSAVQDDEIDYSAVTLSDFTNDVGYRTNNSDVNNTITYTAQTVYLNASQSGGTWLNTSGCVIIQGGRDGSRVEVC